MAKRAHPGRPTVKASPGVRSTVSLRLTAETKDKIDLAAKGKGRPFSHEAELRLERSFEREGLLSEVLKLAYDPVVAGVLIAVGTLMITTGRHVAGEKVSKGKFGGGSDWTQDPEAFDQALRAGIDLLGRLLPVGAHDIKNPISGARPMVNAGELARAIRGMAKTEWPAVVFGKENVETARTLLGDAAKNIATDGPEMVAVYGKLKKY